MFFRRSRSIARRRGLGRMVDPRAEEHVHLGRERPAVACGGCQTPLDVDGIPARTNSALQVPFRLVFDAPEGS